MAGDAAAPVSPAPRRTPALRQLRERHGVRARKSLGQHFLVNRGVLRRIAAAAELTPDDVVIEVGPGLGALTQELAATGARIIAVEKDEAMAQAVSRELAGHANVRVVQGDMLELAPGELLLQCGLAPPYKMVSNLPYNVGTAILRRFLEAETRPALLVVLLQREVAQNIAATPGAMSLLSVAVQLYAEPAILGIVRPGSFAPPPRVDSAMMRLRVRPHPLGVSEGETAPFLDLVRAGFSARRKQLANSLSQGLGITRVEAVALLHAAGVAPQRRAETLSLAEWAALYRARARAT